MVAAGIVVGVRAATFGFAISNATVVLLPVVGAVAAVLIGVWLLLLSQRLRVSSEPPPYSG